MSPKGHNILVESAALITFSVYFPERETEACRAGLTQGSATPESCPPTPLGTYKFSTRPVPHCRLSAGARVRGKPRKQPRGIG